MSGPTGGRRSDRWFQPDTLRGFSHRSRIFQGGFDRADLDGGPVIAIINTWNELSTCHGHFPTRVEAIRRGVLQAGGLPVELPAMGLAEPFQKPSTMLYRNLLAMEVEELLHSYPIDGAVLMAGCDKTTPALVMAVLSLDIPAIMMPAGPMLSGDHEGGTVGSGTDQWRLWDERRADTFAAERLRELETGIARSPGTCMTMGTASTMTALVDVMGLTLPGASSLLAVDSRHAAMATRTGRRAVELVDQEVRPRQLVTRDSLLDALDVLMALGGSTNAIIHLLAIARRAGVTLDLDDVDAASRTTSVIANVKPTGAAHLMEDFCAAGGIRALMTRLDGRLRLDRPSGSGRSWREELEGVRVFRPEVIRTVDDPVVDRVPIAVLRGNLAPDGSVIKACAATPELTEHEGPAVVFDGILDLAARLDDERTVITADSVLVLRGAGPVGGPGMPEWGMLPIPQRLLREGVRDMVRISDARMSGTSYGTCVLHVAPEAAIGGPLALVRDGDRIRLSVRERRLDLLVDDAELARRRAMWRPPVAEHRGWTAIYVDDVLQANEGCDLRSLAVLRERPEPTIF